MIKEIKEKRCLWEPSTHLNQLLDISDDLLMICYTLQILQRNLCFLEGFFFSK